MVTEKELSNFASVWKRVTETEKMPAVPSAEDKKQSTETVYAEKLRAISRAVRFLPGF